MTTVLILGGLGEPACRSPQLLLRAVDSRRPGAALLLSAGNGQDATRHLLPHLFSLPDGEQPNFVRIVDRPLLVPAADFFTCYADGTFRKALKEGVAAGTVEYVQGNLLIEGTKKMAFLALERGKESGLTQQFRRAGTRQSAFALPPGHGGPAKSFDCVFDFTGEFDHDTPDAVRSVPACVVSADF